MDRFDQHSRLDRMSDPSFLDFGPVDRFLVGAIGPPGQRTFYFFILANERAAWFKCEKSQAAALGEQGLELLSTLGWDLDEDVVDSIMSLFDRMPPPSAPDDVHLRIRSIAMRVDSKKVMTMMIQGDEDDPGVAFTITAEQLRAAGLLALKAVHSGRPRCQECLLPEDPDGHHCPSGNGHRPP